MVLATVEHEHEAENMTHRMKGKNHTKHFVISRQNADAFCTFGSLVASLQGAITSHVTAWVLCLIIVDT